MNTQTASAPARYTNFIDAEGKPLDGPGEHAAMLDTKLGIVVKAELIAIESQRGIDKAIKDLNASNFGGRSDWRCATLEEAFLTADRTRHSPAMDTTVFKNVDPYDWIWTREPAAYSPEDCAWFVDLRLGFAYWNGRYNSGFVLAVAPSQ